MCRPIELALAEHELPVALRIGEGDAAAQDLSLFDEHAISLGSK
jgi:hypothetical protein